MRRSGGIRRLVARLLAALALMAVVPVAQSASASESMSGRATVRYTVELKTPGMPVIPFLERGVRACTSPTNCKELFFDFEVSGAYAFDAKSGSKISLIPWITMPNGSVVDGASRAITLGSSRDLGTLRFAYPGPTAEIVPGLTLENGSRFAFPMLTICPVGVDLDEYCAGGGGLLIPKGSPPPIVVPAGTWRVATGYSRYTFDPETQFASSRERVVSTSRTITLAKGTSRTMNETVKVPARGSFVARVDLTAPEDFSTSGRWVTALVDLCKGYSCGSTARIFLQSGGLTTVKMPTAIGDWTLRVRLVDNCENTMFSRPNERITMTANAKVSRTFSFTLTELPPADQCE
jgi:hypothetical protein